MAAAYLSSNPDLIYNLPALLVIATVVGGCFCWLLTLFFVQFVNRPGVVYSWTGIVDFALTARVCARAAALSLRSAFQRVAAAFPRRRRSFEQYELTSPGSLAINAAATVASASHGVLEHLPVHSRQGSSTGSNGSTTYRPNSPNGSLSSTGSVAEKDGATGSSDAQSVLEANAFPWASFVAPWDLIAASATPRASSVLEAATGHSDQGSVDAADAQV